MTSRRTEATRALLGIQVIETRYQVVLRSLLRLISLGTLDNRTLRTRALLIIVGNKEVDYSDARETESNTTWASLRRRARAHTLQSWITRRRNSKITYCTAAAPQAKARHQQACDSADGSGATPMFRQQSYIQAQGLSHGVFSPPCPRPPTPSPPPPLSRPIPTSMNGMPHDIRTKPERQVESQRLIHETRSGPCFDDLKPQIPHPPPWATPSESGLNQKGKEKEIFTNEAGDALSEHDSLYASSLAFTYDTITDPARSRVQQLLARWTAPEDEPFTPSDGENNDLNGKPAVGPGAPPVEGRGMAGSMHDKPEDNNEEAALTESQASAAVAANSGRPHPSNNQEESSNSALPAAQVVPNIAANSLGPQYETNEVEAAAPARTDVFSDTAANNDSTPHNNNKNEGQAIGEARDVHSLT